jgi:NAD(P)-dependent dehydrogenase (short-subunit alcohol dehydrogenase family)
MSSKMERAAIAITGVASGLGAAFLDYYSSQDATQPILAIDRNTIHLPSHLQNQARIQTFTADVTDPESLAALATEMKHRSVSLLLHCAGVRGLVSAIVQSNPGDVAAAETLEVMDISTLMKTFEINCIGTFNIIRTLMPSLQKYNSGRQVGKPPPRCVVLGSRMGSMSANVNGGAYAYRASKAALNAIIKSFSIDVKEIVFAIIHPGRVETGLVSLREEGAMTAEESIKTCVQVIDGLGSESSGSFLDRVGQKIEW